MADVNLQPFFYPETVAIIGASGTPGKVGHTIVSNMIEAGYKGRLIPVNPKGGEIMGLEVVTAIPDLPQGLDLAVLSVPRKLVIPSMKELGAIGCRSAIVITAGFKEVGKEGYDLEQELVAVAAEHSMALLGPNCLGMMNTAAGINASFAAGQPRPGQIAFFSQSGALCVAILDWALGENIGFSKFVSLGNKAALSEAEMLSYLADDEQTNVILGYVENVEHGVEFMARAEPVCRKKPVVMIKSGTTAAGAKAASSHTGAIAGSDNAYTAAFKRSGIIRVDDVETLFNLAEAFSNQPLPKGPNLAVVTNSGGPGILTADAVEGSTLNLARPSAKTVERLQSFLPPYAALYNPIDIIGDADAERYRLAMEAVMEDELVHSLLVLLTPTASVDVEGTAAAVAALAKRRPDKPVFTCFMGKKRVEAGRRILQEAGIPCYAFPEPAVESISTMYDHFLRRQIQRPEPEKIERDLDAARAVVDKAKAKNQMEIVEFEAQTVLAAYGLPTPRTRLARSSDQAAAAAREIGFPVVMKIASPHISHKSDVGGVKVGMDSEEAVRATFADITTRAQRMRPEAYIVGCLIQEMAPKGCKEIIIGFKRDEQFGPLLMFGLGGIYVEILKDIAFRLAPMTRRDAMEMMREVQSYMLLKGVRGEEPVNFEALADILLSMSQLSLDLPEVVEAEFNPVLVNHERAIVADVRMTLKL